MTPALAPASPKRPRTQAQKEASARNGAKSRGPRTAEGKAISSRNNTRHGCHSQAFAQELATRAAHSEASLQAFLAASGLPEDEAFECWLHRRNFAVEMALANGELDLHDYADQLLIFGREPWQRSRERYYKAFRRARKKAENGNTNLRIFAPAQPNQLHPATGPETGVPSYLLPCWFRSNTVLPTQPTP